MPPLARSACGVLFFFAAFAITLEHIALRNDVFELLEVGAADHRHQGPAIHGSQRRVQRMHARAGTPP